jgi:hypothetical protein
VRLINCLVLDAPPTSEADNDEDAACTAWSCGRAKCSMDCERVMCWNVRGLNARARGDVVQQLVSDE